MSHAERGFSLPEMMVALVISSLALGLAGKLFVASRNAFSDEMARQETFQGLRASLDTLERDLRIGGACLPATSTNFPALSSNNYGTLDGFTTRTALVRSDLTCIQNQINAGTAVGATTLPLAPAWGVNGFAVGQRGYISYTNYGELFNITGVNATSNQLTITPPLLNAYQNGSTVWAIDERVYKVNTTAYAPVTVLTITANGGAEMPFAYGVQAVDIKYQLASNCPPCLTVDLPTAAQWPLVNQLFVTMTMISRNPLSTGQYYTVSATIGAKPRNLLPGTQILGPTPR